jgi:hypothetical protein
MILCFDILQLLKAKNTTALYNQCPGQWFKREMIIKDREMQPI